jgi:hypothetical protein
MCAYGRYYSCIHCGHPWIQTPHRHIGSCITSYFIPTNLTMKHTMNITKNKFLSTLRVKAKRRTSSILIYSVNNPKHLRSKQAPFDLKHTRGLANGRHRESRVHNRDSYSAEQIGMARLTGVSSQSLSRCGALSQGHTEVNN